MQLEAFAFTSVWRLNRNITFFLQTIVDNMTELKFVLQIIYIFFLKNFIYIISLNFCNKLAATEKF
jgi:hypothetical protein